MFRFFRINQVSAVKLKSIELKLNPVEKWQKWKIKHSFDAMVFNPIQDRGMGGLREGGETP